MPPPIRRKKKDVRGTMSTNPPHRVGVPLGGYRTATFTQAIRCWAQLMEPASLTVAQQISPAEWEYLALAGEGREHAYDPEDQDPGDQLSQRVQSALAYRVGAELLKPAQAQRLAERLRKLDYLHAWAVIWALQWRRDFVGGGAAIEEGEEWWALAHRRKHLGETPKPT